MNSRQTHPISFRDQAIGLCASLVVALSLDTPPALADNETGQAADRWNFPEFSSDEQRKVFEGWVPYWDTPSGKFPAADDYEGWLKKRSEKNNTPVIKALNEKGRPARLIIYPGVGRGFDFRPESVRTFADDLASRDAVQRAARFMRTHLAR